MEIPPLVVAPMAGGPSTSALALAGAEAGALGFLAAAYKTPDQVGAELRALGGRPFGLNIFVPVPPPDDLAPVRAYRELLKPEADRYGVTLPELRADDDDHYRDKIELAVAAAVPLVTFTFGVPAQDVVAALHRAGTRVGITVTGPDEAKLALDAGADLLVVQGATAGGHSGTLSPATFEPKSTALTSLFSVRPLTRLPIVSAGGVGGADDVRTLLAAGADAVAAGTAFLLAPEAGTRAAQRAAMESGAYPNTVLTRAFTGHPARALRNRFTDTYSPHAPIGYPAIHHLTAPIRAAASAAGDPSALNLWSGTSPEAARPIAAAETIALLAP